MFRRPLLVMGSGGVKCRSLVTFQENQSVGTASGQSLRQMLSSHKKYLGFHYETYNALSPFRRPAVT